MNVLRYVAFGILAVLSAFVGLVLAFITLWVIGGAP